MAPLPAPDPELELPPIHLRLHPVTGRGATNVLEGFGSKFGETIASHSRIIVAALYDSPPKRAQDAKIPQSNTISSEKHSWNLPCIPLLVTLRLALPPMRCS